MREIAKLIATAYAAMAAADKAEEAKSHAQLRKLEGGLRGAQADIRRKDNIRAVNAASKAIAEMVAAIRGGDEATEEQRSMGQAIIERAYAAGIRF